MKNLFKFYSYGIWNGENNTTITLTSFLAFTDSLKITYEKKQSWKYKYFYFFLGTNKYLLQMGFCFYRSSSRLSIVISLHVVVVVLTSLSQFHSIYSIPVDVRCEYGWCCGGSFMIHNCSYMCMLLPALAEVEWERQKGHNNRLDVKEMEVRCRCCKWRTNIRHFGWRASRSGHDSICSKTMTGDTRRIMRILSNKAAGHN